MAALTSAQAVQVWHAFVAEQLQEVGQGTNLSKVELKAAVDAVNTWIDNNAASYVSNLASNASSFNTASTAQQKAILMIYVLIVKYNLASAVLR